MSLKNRFPANTGSKFDYLLLAHAVSFSFFILSLTSPAHGLAIPKSERNYKAEKRRPYDTSLSWRHLWLSWTVCTPVSDTLPPDIPEPRSESAEEYLWPQVNDDQGKKYDWIYWQEPVKGGGPNWKEELKSMDRSPSLPPLPLIPQSSTRGRLSSSFRICYWIHKSM